MTNNDQVILALLKRIEWKGDREWPICPECKGNDLSGHYVGCILHQMIETLKREA